jgi:hypothetical protein
VAGTVLVLASVVAIMTGRAKSSERLSEEVKK